MKDIRGLSPTGRSVEAAELSLDICMYVCIYMYTNRTRLHVGVGYVAGGVSSYLYTKWLYRDA